MNTINYSKEVVITHFCTDKKNYKTGQKIKITWSVLNALTVILKSNTFSKCIASSESVKEGIFETVILNESEEIPITLKAGDVEETIYISVIKESLWDEIKYYIYAILALFAFTIYFATQNTSKENANQIKKQENKIQQKNVTPSKFKGNQLENGTSPYYSIFGKGIYDKNSLHKIKFKAAKYSDVIVCLVHVANNKIIRNEYIRKGETFEMTKIPDGTYYLKSIYGNDWNPNKMIFNNQVQGAFDTDLSFSKSDDVTDRFLFSQKKTAEGISYATYEVTLYLVKHGNMESERINENEFFE